MTSIASPSPFAPRRRNRAFGPVVLLAAAGALLAVNIIPTDASAQRAGVRAGAVSGPNGSAARGGRFVNDGAGNAAARRGGCASGAGGAGCRGSATAVGSDGSVSRRSGVEVQGSDGGFFSSRGQFDRAADGATTGSRTTSASGSQGAYEGSSSLSGGVFGRSGVYSNDNGSRAVDSTYERGVGGSRTVTCTDASGVVVSCPN